VLYSPPLLRAIVLPLLPVENPRAPVENAGMGWGKAVDRLGKTPKKKIRIKNYGEYVTIYGDPIP